MLAQEICPEVPQYALSLAECLQKTGQLNLAIEVCQLRLFGTELEDQAKQLCATMMFEQGMLADAQSMLASLEDSEFDPQRQYFIDVN